MYPETQPSTERSEREGNRGNLRWNLCRDLPRDSSYLPDWMCCLSERKKQLYPGPRHCRPTRSAGPSAKRFWRQKHRIRNCLLAARRDPWKIFSRDSRSQRIFFRSIQLRGWSPAPRPCQRLWSTRRFLQVRSRFPCHRCPGEVSRFVRIPWRIRDCRANSTPARANRPDRFFTTSDPPVAVAAAGKRVNRGGLLLGRL